MQNRYAGDIGDYVKLSMLRAVAAGKRTGILWWLHADESHNADGKHVAYLKRPLLWRSKDPELFDRLRHVVTSGTRSVGSLQQADLLNRAVYFDEIIPTAGVPADRRRERRRWFERAMHSVVDCNLVFLDPDNGLETSSFEAGKVKAAKSVALAELKALQRPGKTLIVYHHHTRRAGGNLAELQYWGERLMRLGFKVGALRASVGTARAFFFLDADDSVQLAASTFAKTWKGKVTWHWIGGGV